LRKGDVQKLSRLTRVLQRLVREGKAELRARGGTTSAPALRDESLSAVLLAHLHMEKALYEWASLCLPHGDRLEGARLSFSQLLLIVQAVSPIVLEDWLLGCITQLNSLRNRFAHRLNDAQRDEYVARFVSHVKSAKSKSGGPPPPIKDTLHGTLDFVVGVLDGHVRVVRAAREIDALEVLHVAKAHGIIAQIIVSG
jgi:hypothetical protein